ncbi:MAG: 2-dehydropantoate 2-reductase [Tissierellia bacterium]|nr:2-dehydropantoate 2-reductase [Tissierellia bacterium]
MKVAVLGAGAMGSLYGGKLSKVSDVYLIDIWKKHVEEINNNGLSIEEPDGTLEKFYPKAYEDSKGLPIMDVVIVFVKSIQTGHAINLHKDIIGDKTILLSLQNGYGNDEDMKAFADEDRIIMGTTSHGCTVKGPGHIFHAGSGDTIIGTYGKDLQNAYIVKELMNKAGFAVETNSNVKEIIVKKVIVNVGINPLTALLDVNNEQIALNDGLRNASEKLVKEAVSVFNAQGLNLDANSEWEHVLAVAKATGANCSSMRADVLNKRKTEINSINGAVASLANDMGLKAPANELITDLIVALENGYL